MACSVTAVFARGCPLRNPVTNTSSRSTSYRTVSPRSVTCTSIRRYGFAHREIFLRSGAWSSTNTIPGFVRPRPIFSGTPFRRHLLRLRFNRIPWDMDCPGTSLTMDARWYL